MNSFDLLLLFLIAWVFVFGACIGSFLNVVILRGFSGESIVFPSSKCPVCNNKLKWWMNIPVLSYLFLRGKCYFCKCKISIQYPIVEFFTGLMFMLIFLKFAISLETLFFMIAVSLLIVMSVCDLKESVIFELHAYLLIAAGLIFNIITGGFSGFIFAVFGGVLGFILYEILARSGYLIAGERAFGEGDSLIAAGIGAFFGWKMMLFSVILSIFVMSAFTLPYFFVYSYKKGNKKTCLALIFAILLVILTYAVTKYELIKNFAGVISFMLALVVSLIFCIKQIFADMKKKDENGEVSLCMLPFGPAMAISFVMIMFFEQNFKTLLESYFG